MYSCGPLHMDEQKLEDQREPISNSFVPIQDVAWRTCREPWTIDMGGERESMKSILAAQRDNDVIGENIQPLMPYHQHLPLTF